MIGAEKLSSITNWDDRGTAVLFGDGAGAVVLQASDKPGILSTHIHSDGQYENLLHVPVESGLITMNGNAVFRKAVSMLDSMAREIIADNQFADGELTWLVPHQANMRIIAAAAKKTNMPMERVIVTVDKHANTSAASIPLALDVAVRDGRIKRATCCCWRRLVRVSPGGRRWCASRAGVLDITAVISPFFAFFM